MTNRAKNLSLDAITMAFEASYDGLHILDKDGNTLYINDACTRIEGITKEEAFMSNIRELVQQGVYSQSVTLMVLESKNPVTITRGFNCSSQLQRYYRFNDGEKKSVFKRASAGKSET